MEANIIVERNSVFDDKQNAEIRLILQIGCHIFSVIETTYARVACFFVFTLPFSN